MLNNIVLGRYYPVKSKIHFMHPLSKILCTILFITMLFLCYDVKLMLLLSFMAVLTFEMAHLPRNLYIKTVLSLRFLIVIIVVINLLVHSTLDLVIINIMQLILIVLYTTILTLTTPPTEITYGLELLFSPLKLIGVPVNKMALSISLALRFIPSIIDQSNKILKSQASRGVDYYNSNLKGKLLAVKSMIMPMFILTIRKADNLAESMEMRLYSINRKRTNFRINKWGLFDTFMFLFHLGVLYLIIVRRMSI